MAKYEVTELSFIGGTLRKEGDVIDFEGEPGPNLKALDKAADKAVKAVPSKAAVRLIAEARLHATARGDSPDNAGEGDFDNAVEALKVKPSDEVKAEVLAYLAAQAAAAASADQLG